MPGRRDGGRGARSRPRVPSRHAGFTLAEAMIASVVLAVAVVGISSVLSASYQQSVSQGEITRALELARELTEAVTAVPFEPAVGAADAAGWAGGVTNRTLYDTIDDFNGYADDAAGIAVLSTGASPAQGSTASATGSGSLLDLGGAKYQRSVTVAAMAAPLGTAPPADFAVVTVTVTTPHKVPVSVQQLCPRVTIVR